MSFLFSQSLSIFATLCFRTIRWVIWTRVAKNCSIVFIYGNTGRFWFRSNLTCVIDFFFVRKYFEPVMDCSRWLMEMQFTLNHEPMHCYAKSELVDKNCGRIEYLRPVSLASLFSWIKLFPRIESESIASVEQSTTTNQLAGFIFGNLFLFSFLFGFRFSLCHIFGVHSHEIFMWHRHWTPKFNRSALVSAGASADLFKTFWWDEWQ